jgi:hypothetical protein
MQWRAKENPTDMNNVTVLCFKHKAGIKQNVDHAKGKTKISSAIFSPIIFPFDRTKMQRATKQYVTVLYQIFAMRSQKKPTELMSSVVI